MKKIVSKFILNAFEFFCSLYGSFKHRNKTGSIETVYLDKPWNLFVDVKSMMKEKYKFIKIVHKQRVDAWGVSIRWAYKIEAWEKSTLS